MAFSNFMTVSVFASPRYLRPCANVVSLAAIQGRSMQVCSEPDAECARSVYDVNLFLPLR